MLKALFKKQLLELSAWFYRDQKSGKNRSRSGVISYVLLFVVVCLSLGSVFYYMASSLCAPLLALQMGWLYHAILCLLAVTLGVFGSVFNTYSTLYMAKDNELLLALPIPPSHILAVRLFGVWFWGLLYEAMVFIPAMLVYWQNASPGFFTLVAELLLLFALSLLVLTISCLLGWLLAKISRRVKAKSLITVLVSLLFLGIYFYVYSQAYTILQQLLTHAEAVGAQLKGAAYPAYLMGRSAEGDWLSLLLLSCLVLALFGLIWFFLSQSFLKLATRNGAAVKKAYRESSVKVQSVSGALLAKERRRFFSSATYMLNCGLGTLMLLVLAVLALVKSDWIRELLAALMPGSNGLAALLACAVICVTATMNDMTAPSVSLEGKTLWLLQSLPVSPWQALWAKLRLQLIATEVPACLCSLSLISVLRPGLFLSGMMLLLPLLFVLLSAAFGLIIGLKMPNLTWTSETAVVKQSMGVLIALFAGWIFLLLLGLLYAWVGSRLTAELFLLLCTALLAVSSFLLLTWLKTKGAKIFERL